MRIENHPIFGVLTKGEKITIYFEGKPLQVIKGQTVVSALMDHGIYVLGHSRNLSQPRGCYCSNGRCHSCMMTINGISHMRSCITLVEDNMTIVRENSNLKVGSDKNEH